MFPNISNICENNTPPFWTLIIIKTPPFLEHLSSWKQPLKEDQLSLLLWFSPILVKHLLLLMIFIYVAIVYLIWKCSFFNPIVFPFSSYTVENDFYVKLPCPVLKSTFQIFFLPPLFPPFIVKNHKLRRSFVSSLVTKGLHVNCTRYDSNVKKCFAFWWVRFYFETYENECENY